MIYIVFGITIMLSYLANKRNKRIYLFLIILVLSLFVGLRGYEVGDDTQTYVQILQNLKNNHWSPNVEVGFSLLSYLLLKMVPSVTFVLVVFSFLTNLFFVARLWTFREKYSFPLMISLYLLLFYPQTCNIVRQYLVIAAIFWGTTLLEKRKYVWFVIVLLISSTIHTSSVIGVVYIPLFVVFDKRLSNVKRRNILIVACALMPVLVYAYFAVANRYFLHYLSASNNSFGLMNIMRMLLVIVAVALSPQIFSIEYEDDMTNCSSLFCPLNSKIILISTVLGIILYFGGYYQTTLIRIGYFFGVFEIPFVAKVVKEGRGKQVMAFAYTLIFAVYFIIQVKSGWSELGNYVFCFQQ